MKNLEQQKQQPLPVAVKFLLLLAIILFLTTRMMANPVYPNLNFPDLSIIASVENINIDDDEEKTALLEQAMLLFENREWEKAKHIFSKYLKSHNDGSQDHLTAVYLYAKSAFNSGNYHRAAEGFSEYLFLQKVTNEQTEDIEWDRAIAFLKVDIDRSRNYLIRMAGDNGHTYQYEAKGLLSIL